LKADEEGCCKFVNGEKNAFLGRVASLKKKLLSLADRKSGQKA
jgi:hypothetical protein